MLHILWVLTNMQWLEETFILLLNNILSSGCTKVYLFIYLLKDILGFSQVFATINETAIHIHVEGAV